MMALPGNTHARRIAAFIERSKAAAVRYDCSTRAGDTLVGTYDAPKAGDNVAALAESIADDARALVDDNGVSADFELVSIDADGKQRLRTTFSMRPVKGQFTGDAVRDDIVGMLSKRLLDTEKLLFTNLERLNHVHELTVSRLLESNREMGHEIRALHRELRRRVIEDEDEIEDDKLLEAAGPIVRTIAEAMSHAKNGTAAPAAGGGSGDDNSGSH